MLADVQLARGRGRPLLPFFENRKECPSHEKNDWVLFLYGLNASFLMEF